MDFAAILKVDTPGTVKVKPRPVSEINMSVLGQSPGQVFPTINGMRAGEQPPVFVKPGEPPVAVAKCTKKLDALGSAVKGARSGMPGAGGVSRDSGTGYYPSHSEGMQAVQAMVKTRGYEISDDNWQRHVSGERKPAEGQTNSYNIPLSKGGQETDKYVHIQVYNRGNHVQNNYEVNSYVDSGKPKIVKTDFAQVLKGAFFDPLVMPTTMTRKANPYHDPGGRFASASGTADGGASGTASKVKPHEQHDEHARQQLLKPAQTTDGQKKVLGLPD